MIPTWLYGNSCLWAHDVWLYIAGTSGTKSTQQATLEVVVSDP